MTSNSFADFNGVANATGGNATNTVNITNSNAIFSTNYGISAQVQARATGFVTASTGTAAGGSAIAGVVITNTLADITGGGIDGEATAKANGGSGIPAFTALGGTATATTNISNTGTITSAGNGVRGEAMAYAVGYADSAVTGSTGTGGHAEAHLLINNTGGSITSTGIRADGIRDYHWQRPMGLAFTRLAEQRPPSLPQISTTT